VNGPALEVTRLLQNPLGVPAPEGERGDIVRVSDGSRTIYLTPREFDEATEQQLRYRLAAEGRTRSNA
jgi:ribosomal protein L9